MRINGLLRKELLAPMALTGLAIVLVAAAPTHVDSTAPSVAPSTAPAPHAFEFGSTPLRNGFSSDIQISGNLGLLAAALRSSQYNDRDDATRTLLHLAPERLSDICTILAKETDPEAAARLTQVATHLYLKGMTSLDGPASLLGIKLNLESIRLNPEKLEDLRMSVAVAELQPGYPAAQDLQVGDRLVAMNGIAFPLSMSIDDFRNQVMARRPGSIVRFTVVREGRLIDVGIQLAGLPAVGVMNLENAIEARNAAMTRFVAGLESGAKSKVQILEDTTPQNNALGDEVFDAPKQ